MLSKKTIKEIGLALILLGFSASMYLVHFFIFRDFHHILIYFIGDIAFLGVDALLVYFVLDRLLNAREKQAARKRLNILAGLFFADIGTKLFNMFLTLQKEAVVCEKEYCVQESWTHQDFVEAAHLLNIKQPHFRYDAHTMLELRDFLANKKDMLIRVLENPGLHEHETFSDMLLAVFHLTEELLRRTDLEHNEVIDQEHLANDVRRAFVYLAQLWLEYMEHLRENYKYLYLYNIKNRQFNF